MDNQEATQYNEQLFLQYARIGKSLSSERRLEILNLLTNGAKSVETIANNTGMSVANVSRHLQILLDANLVTYKKQGKYVIYSLASEDVEVFLRALWKISENQLSEVSRLKHDFHEDYADVQTISQNDVLERVANGDMTVLDIRPREEYESEHIDGALSVPMEDLDTFLLDASKNSQFAVYCRGPYCIYTTQAVDQMLKQGFQAYRIEEDVFEWQAAK
ncbi:ArsR/SmtB family transcription factor [Fundicoccus culcitae]|uniref:Metalloregulator ArsR/SmtB family transcription factor n=1 Tax=Fundicoccus culcitae TaxID=2969821 RepID=A0ABY5P3Z3_9LACT|nr:metalloregulator ArsR/SmtB family transcription factor [Fundicoccus culcitae]UUX33461.1 metalloregulator ArsR/SmtB family transcription factor [Fundicoccus culcitae]